jgi:hypothetical protein
VSLLGHIVFRVEGGLIVNRMRWALAQVRRQADFECSGPECCDASDILDLMRGDIPLVNEARIAVMGTLGVETDICRVRLTARLGPKVQPNPIRWRFVEKD